MKAEEVASAVFANVTTCIWVQIAEKRIVQTPYGKISAEIPLRKYDFTFKQDICSNNGKCECGGCKCSMQFEGEYCQDRVCLIIKDKSNNVHRLIRRRLLCGDE